MDCEIDEEVQQQVQRFSGAEPWEAEAFIGSIRKLGMPGAMRAWGARGERDPGDREDAFSMAIACCCAIRHWDFRVAIHTGREMGLSEDTMNELMAAVIMDPPGDDTRDYAQENINFLNWLRS